MDWVVNQINKLRNHFGGSSLFLDMIILSISAGTFFYVGTIEILVDEMNKLENRGYKFLSFLFGLLSIYYIVTTFRMD